MVAGKALLDTDFTFDILYQPIKSQEYILIFNTCKQEYKITATAGLNGKVAIGENSNSKTVYQNNVNMVLTLH